MDEQDIDEPVSNQHVISDDELVAICKSELEQSIGGSGEDENIARATEYYLGKRPYLSTVEDKDPRASRIVSMDVMDAVEATTAEIMQMYSAEEIAYFQPTGPDDEKQCRLESDLINKQFLEEYDGYIVLQVAIKDAQIHRNGAVKVYWDRRYKVSFEIHENVPEPALPYLMQPTMDGEYVEVIEQIVDGSQTGAAAGISPSGTTAVVEVETPTYSYKIKRTRIVEQASVENILPEQIRVCGDHESPYLDDARFVAHEKIETESSLIEQGFDPDLVRGLSTYSYDQEVNYARQRESQESLHSSQHHSMRPIQVCECYILVDKDGDGIAERRKVVLSGSTLLSDEEYDGVPIKSGVGIIMPHRYQGISLMDRLEDIQDGKTDLMRAIINGGKLAARPRIGMVSGEVNIEDMLMSATGGFVRMESVNSVFPFPNPEIPQSVFGTVQFLDNTRRERGGSAIDVANQAQALAGDTAHGLERTMSAIELYNSMVARTIGETLVRGIYLELHKLYRKHYAGELQAQVGGRWIRSNPSEWGERSKCIIELGSSNNERMRQAAAMAVVIERHKLLHEMQAPMVDMATSYRAIVDADRLAGVKYPERYYIDPESDYGRQKVQRMEQTANENKQRQEEMELGMVQAQQILAQAEQMKAQVQQQNSILKAEVDRLKAQIQAIKNDADMALQAQKQSNDFALGVTKLEIESGRELSRNVESNR